MAPNEPVADFQALSSKPVVVQTRSGVAPRAGSEPSSRYFQVVVPVEITGSAGTSVAASAGAGAASTPASMASSAVDTGPASPSASHSSSWSCESFVAGAGGHARARPYPPCRWPKVARPVPSSCNRVDVPELASRRPQGEPGASSGRVALVEEGQAAGRELVAGGSITAFGPTPWIASSSRSVVSARAVNVVYPCDASSRAATLPIERGNSVSASGASITPSWRSSPVS